MTELRLSSLFEDPLHSAAYHHVMRYEYPWEVIPNIKDIILEIGQALGEGYTMTAQDIWVANDARVAPSATINGPAIIMSGAEVRPSAYIRGSVLIGRGAVVGNSTEIKNSILFDGVQVPHFNYVGDSILGYKSHLGAGAVTSNVKSDKSCVTVRLDEGKISTGLLKFGAILADYVEVGCNSVLNPGTIIGRHTSVYPLSLVRGYIPPHSILKENGVIVKKR